MLLVLCLWLFFKQKTAYEMRISDWSSDVCSSDLIGTVIAIDADDGMKVEAGQPLVELDPNDAQVAYDQAVANLAGTVRQVRGLYSSVDAGQADIKARKIAVAQARADVERRAGLVASGAVSREGLAPARAMLAAAGPALSGPPGPHGSASCRGRVGQYV